LTMRFLADENFPGNVAIPLELEGHDVFWVRLRSPGAKDADILSRAQAEKRILLTFDKDFGELAFLAGLPSACGIILFRLDAASPKQQRDRIMAVLHQKIEWANHFAVVGEDRIRLTPISKVNPYK
jgi:predicted nuclease of predicted toxin-antitoxin system